jgi:hypothetical protein
MFVLITWDRTRPLGGKYRTVSWEGRGVVLVSRHQQGCSRRLCRLMTDGLAPVSKYWTYQSHAGDMGPVSLVACYRHMFGFHYYFNGCVERETGWRTCGSLSWAGFVSGALFLGSSWVCPTLLMACERLPRMGTVRRKHMSDVCGLAWEVYVSCWWGFPLQGVQWFESPWLSDMSNRLFVVVFT